MARPREFDEQKVVAALKETFWLRGYEGASYSELTTATGLKKGSLYAAFGDKRALYMRALRDYDEQEVDGGVALLTQIIEPALADGRKRIETLFNMVVSAVAQGDRRGCLLCDAAGDQAQLDPAVEKAVSQGFMRIQIAFQKCLGDMTEKPLFAEEAAQSASHLTAAYFGMRVMAKAGAPLAMLEQSRDFTLRTI